MAQEALDQVNPSQIEIAAAAARQSAQAAAQAAHDARLDALDIRDPSGLSQEAAPEEPKPKAPQVPETVPGAKVADFSDDLLRRAYDAGYSADQARRFGTPDNLEYALSTLARREAELYRQVPQYPQQQQIQQPPEEEGLPEYPDVFEPEVAGALSARDKILLQQQQELAELKKQNQQNQQFLQQLHAQQAERTWHEAVAATPEEYQEELGTSVFNASQAQQQKQQEVASLVDAMMIQNQQAGRRNPPVKELYLRAVKAVVGNKTPTRAVEESHRAANGRFISPPTQTSRTGDSVPRNLSEDQRTQGAVREIAEKLRAERGF